MSSIRSGSTGVVLFALALSASGCDDGKAATVREKKCGEICTRYEMCDDATDQTGCEENCNAEAFRSDTYFEVKAQCVTDLSCNRLGDRDDSAELADCVGDALRDKQPDDEAITLCKRLANRLPDCEADLDSDQVQSDCEGVAITLSDEYLDGTSACSDDNACKDVAGCLDELADTYDTDIKVYPVKSSN